jgi:hypothetical protein
MRYEGHCRDLKGPASVRHARAALDKDGAVIGYAFGSKGFSRVDIDTNESARLQFHRPADRDAFEAIAQPNPMVLPTSIWRGRRWHPNSRRPVV